MSQDIALGREYKRRVVHAFHERVAKVVLFGSRARGDSRPDSDWDIAVFLTDDPTLDDRYRLTDLGTDLLVDTGEFIQPVALPLRRAGEESYRMQAIRTDGIDL
ncbi:nucleotidyltransferase domain-containing protein [Reyranella sp.]|uniref:nucleotidyltransferase domain-containing protein n=1 Tax=Reyranella sp. TaxID=1929291 RepID=UPI003D0984F8